MQLHASGEDYLEVIFVLKKLTGDVYNYFGILYFFCYNIISNFTNE
ncbi:hypothetical protein LGL55_21620 [Clostridium tagluense]|nr:hypothetical protein [Clostridium tagluense]MCB2313693.1 hypothetical protein [Clostridium tagluense]MCB2318543.1 hypothetical protein [Clostridium tagluense]MCB2323355.1 hypothetical protein [Clostridium tagluense]MCB2328352.1 hypothetical protein [Clostridium tagluense]MCB2333186.1 hypothetical protein [Clostridium tagluense]